MENRLFFKFDEEVFNFLICGERGIFREFSDSFFLIVQRIILYKKTLKIQLDFFIGFFKASPLNYQDKKQ